MLAKFKIRRLDRWLKLSGGSVGVGELDGFAVLILIVWRAESGKLRLQRLAMPRLTNG